MSSNRGNWRGRGRGNRGQFQGSGGRGAGGGRGQFSGEDRGRGGGRGGHGNDGHRGAGGSRGQSYGEDRGRSGGRGGHGHFQDDGNHGAGGSGSQSYGGGRGRSEGRSDYHGRGEGRGRGSRGRDGADGGNFEPAEVVVNLPNYGALKKDLKEYPISDTMLVIPKRNRTDTDMEKSPHFQQKRSFMVEVNYVSITFTNPKNTKVFHYHVKISPVVASKSVYRSVMDQMRSRYYNTRHPAFDGECNLYAAVKPLFEDSKKEQLSTEENNNPITLTNNGRVTDFHVKITIVNPNLNMQNLNSYMKSGTSLERPLEMQALEIALKGNLPTRLIQVGKRAFYPEVGDFKTLSAGTQLRHGLFQGFVIGKDAKYLNVDVAHKGFPIAQGVLDYLKAKLKSLPTQLSTNEQDGLGRYLKGLKIQYKDPKDRLRNYKNGKLTPEGSDRTTFKKEDGSVISVYQYFVDEYNYKIQHRGLPLLDTGNASKDKHIYLPLELCSIAPNQTVMKAYTPEETDNMVRECSDKPAGRKEKVLDNVSGFADLDVIIDIRNANYASDEVLSEEFGIAVGNKLLEVKAMVLKPPEIKYNSDIKSKVRNGAWTPEKFRTSKQLSKWVILNKHKEDQNDNDPEVIKSFTKAFISRGKELNLIIDQPLETISSVGSSKEDIKKDFSGLKKKFPELQLVVVVLPYNKSASAVYQHVKCVSELKEGILTQCVNWDTLRKMKKNQNATTTVSNILLKVNAKLGGTNYILPDFVDSDTMFMGADVTHAGIGSINPSLATVTGSCNSSAFFYEMVYSVQESRCEPIVKMEDHAKSLLELYKEKNKKFPSKIYYYRDGVSEGQFGEVKRTELMAIKEAGKKLKIPKLRVTFLVAQKRHHTRLFPMGSAGDEKTGNVVAGTVINQTITHPTEHDFFLVSHQSIQGTARPTKYHVIHNEIGTSDDKIESITYYLCHLFARCTRSVKYPAPTYYAHVAGKRIEHHVKGTVDEEASVIDLLANGRVHPNVATNNPMFFI